MSFTKKQISIIEEGLQEIFDELGIETHMRFVKTSARSASLYIDFTDRVAKRIRVSTHAPVMQQKRYINIYED